MNYLIVLFKNKRRKKIINKFITFERAQNYFNDLNSQSQDVIFNVEVENGLEVDYQIGLVGNDTKQDFPVYLIDELGRNVKVKLEEDGMKLIRISPFKKEELIYDLDRKTKITVKYFIDTYLKTKELKMLSILNNKIILQRDEKINIFSLKSENEATRFMNVLSNHFLKNKRIDCLFIKDTSTAQRKYLYELLMNNGFDKKIFYRKFTTHPLAHPK